MIRVRVGSRVNMFLFQIKKIKFGSDIFRVESGRVGSEFCHVSGGKTIIEVPKKKILNFL